MHRSDAHTQKHTYEDQHSHEIFVMSHSSRLYLL